MPLLLIAFPFLEFWTLLELSARAGALATMGYIVLMMIVGYWLLQWAGRSALMTAGRFTSASAIRGQLFAGEISVAFGAVLLMIPGVISDVLALYIFFRAALRALLGAVPPLRQNRQRPQSRVISHTVSRLIPMIGGRLRSRVIFLASTTSKYGQFPFFLSRISTLSP
jgi:UPF0716 protein FxsA